jgi:hypothetical protein
VGITVVDEELVGGGVDVVVVGDGVDDDVGGVHMEIPQGFGKQVHPAFMLQPLQPSPLTVLPSSQASSEAFFPSPQGDWHVSGVVGVPPVQMKPHSTVQVAEHPSPASEAPSSHPSVPAFWPSPQTVLHVD